ncbi:MAG: HlyC/CorC family transporter [Deltaproteobacteria bacterium]|nr:HlyC/CorC family transporter [Deltaproteobacteria bacterium]
MTLLIFYVALALSVSFLCSVMEAVLLSVTPAFVAGMEQKRPKYGERLRTLKDQVDRPLAAILSLNTIAHTVGAAGAGAQAAAVFGDVYVGVISAVLTFLILVISEIIPKTLGAVYWRRLVPVVLRLLRLTIWAMWPLVKLAQGLTRMMAPGRENASIRRDEFVALARIGAQEGVFAEHESRILLNLFRFRDVRTRDIMTPRTVIFAFEETSTVGQALADHRDPSFTRVPVYTNDLDDAKGFVLHADVLLMAAQQKRETRLSELKRPIPLVPENTPLPDLFERFMRERAHVALAVNEYGGTEGLVTMEDLVETLLGLEIVDESDTVADMREFARQRWRVRARNRGIVKDVE